MLLIKANMQATNCIPYGTTVTLSRQSQVDSFPINYPGCDVVEGYLTITGNDIINLNGLIGLKIINGIFTIKSNPLLIDLNGLRSLEYIGTYLHIIDNSSLTVLNGLNSLALINGGFTIENNSKLINLNGLDNLISVNNIDIINDSLLVNLDGLNSITTISSIRIENNLNLNNIRSLNSITSLNGISINKNPLLINLDGLNSITSSSGISINDNQSLVNLSALNSLTGDLSALSLVNNASLVSLIGLNKLRNIDFITINYNPLLLNLEGLNSVEKVHVFYLRHNTNLLNLIGLDSLIIVRDLFLIEVNQSLKSLKGLDKLYSSNSLFVQYNPSLINLEGLGSFKVANYNAAIINNNSLTSLKGLGAMISGNLYIQENPNLSNVNGLDSLKSLNSLNIINNPKLENISGLNPLVILSSLNLNFNPILNCCFAAKIIINNNPTLNTNIYANDIGCNSVPEIMSLTPTSTCCITSYTKDTITICQGQNIKVGTNTYSTTGIYNDTIKIGIGCDSIIITNLTVRPKSYQIINKSLCVGQQFRLSNGKIITTNGIYKDTIPNFCDSIIEYRVSFVNNIIVNQNATVCQGKNYILPKGNSVNTSGIYKDTLRASFGCDSIIITNLTITKPIPFVISVSICKGKSYTLPNGNIVSNSGFYFDTLRKPNTCDSIVITNLTITNPTPFPNNITICKGKSYTLPNGNIVSNSGTFYDTIRKPNTCDSIVITNLTVNPYLQSSQTSTNCLGKTYTLPTGKIVTQSGIYKDTIQDNNGCDSIITTNLTFTNPIPFIKKDSICVGQSYTLPNGKTVTVAGVYNDTIKKINTCDSIITTTLSVFPNVFSVQLNAIDSIDAGNSIELKPTYTNDSASIWNWSPANNLSCTACENPIANPTQNSVYIVKATTQNGCQDTAKTTIIVKQVEVHIPAAFSPNNDGVNDELTVFVNNPISFHIAIYNRWSELLFESNDVNLKWNGMYKNEIQAVDDYTYILDVVTRNGKQHHKQGIITLVR